MTEQTGRLMAKYFPSIAILIPGLKQGDDAAWNSLCDKFRDGLISKARYLFNSVDLNEEHSPEDLVQETLLKAWKQRATFRGTTTSQLAKWMLTILRNTLRDWCRRDPPKFNVATWFGFSDQGESPSAEFLSLEQEAELHACLAELEPRSQQVLNLRTFEGLKFSEIAEKLGLNINTVAGIYRRGILKLTEMMNQQETRNAVK